MYLVYLLFSFLSPATFFLREFTIMSQSCTFDLFYLSNIVSLTASVSEGRPSVNVFDSSNVLQALKVGKLSLLFFVLLPLKLNCLG